MNIHFSVCTDADVRLFGFSSSSGVFSSDNMGSTDSSDGISSGNFNQNWAFSGLFSKDLFNSQRGSI